MHLRANVQSSTSNKKNTKLYYFSRILRQIGKIFEVKPFKSEIVQFADFMYL